MGVANTDKRLALDIYLRDHLAGAMAGVQLARRIARRRDEASRRELQLEIARDRRQLLEFTATLGVREGWLRSSLAAAGEVISRLKFGSWFDRSHSGELLELETLALGIEGKRRLWTALRVVDDPRLDQAILATLEARACQQLDVVEELRLDAARRILPHAA